MPFRDTEIRKPASCRAGFFYASYFCSMSESSRDAVLARIRQGLAAGPAPLPPRPDFAAPVHPPLNNADVVVAFAESFRRVGGEFYYCEVAGRPGRAAGGFPGAAAGGRALRVGAGPAGGAAGGRRGVSRPTKPILWPMPT